MPGSASFSGTLSVAWVADRKRSTPAAIDGSTHSVSKAVMMPSRPNGELNQGTPAYGYGPLGVLVSIICRSAAERVSHSLNCSLAVSMWHASAAPARSAPTWAARAASKWSACGWSPSLQQLTATRSTRSWSGSSGTSQPAAAADSRSGGGSKPSVQARSRPSSPR